MLFPPLQLGRSRAAEPGCPATLPLAKEASSTTRWITAALCWFLLCKQRREKKQLRFCAVQGLSLQECSWPVVTCRVFILSRTGNQRGSAMSFSRSRSKARLVLTQTEVRSLDKPRRPSQSIINSHFPALLRGKLTSVPKMCGQWQGYKQDLWMLDTGPCLCGVTSATMPCSAGWSRRWVPRYTNTVPFMPRAMPTCCVHSPALAGIRSRASVTLQWDKVTPEY